MEMTYPEDVAKGYGRYKWFPVCNKWHNGLVCRGVRLEVWIESGEGLGCRWSVYSTVHLASVAKDGVLGRWADRPDRLRLLNHSRCHARHPLPLHLRKTNRVLDKRLRDRWSVCPMVHGSSDKSTFPQSQEYSFVYIPNETYGGTEGTGYGKVDKCPYGPNRLDTLPLDWSRLKSVWQLGYKMGVLKSV